MNVKPAVEGAEPVPVLDGEFSELDQLYRTAPVGFCLVDRDLRFIRINERMAEIDGRPVADHIGRTVREMIPEISGTIETLCRQVIDTGQPARETEIAVDRPGEPGRKSTFLVSHYPFGRGPGDVQGISIVVRDITARKRMEDVMRENEEQFRFMADSLPVLLSFIDDEERYQYNNAEYERRYGLSPETIRGRTIREVLGDAAYDTIRDRVHRALGGELVAFQSEIPVKVTGPRYFDVTYIPSRDSAGRVRGFYCLVLDITEQKKSEDALRESEDRFRTLFEFSPDAIVLLDAGTMKFVDFNRNAEKLLGLTPDRLYQVGPAEISPPFQPDGRPSAGAAEALIARAARGGQVTFEWTHRHADGHEIPCEIRLVRFPSKDRLLIRGNMTDITERKAGRRALNERLRFEALVSEISGKFIHIPVEEIDRGIDAALGRLGTFLQVDRCHLGEFSEDRTDLIPTHFWFAEGVEKEALDRLNIRQQFPWFLERISGGEDIVISRLEDLPEAASRERDYSLETGLKSAIFLSLSVGGRPVGVFGIDSVRRQRDWDPDLIPRLKILGGIFANALTRKRAEARERESDARYRQVLESTNAIPWEADGRTWMSTYVGPQAEKLMGYPVGMWYRKDFWIEHIHPEDRDHAVNFLMSSIRTCDEFSFEYRMIAADGRIVWFNDFVTVVKSGKIPTYFRGLMVDVTERKRAELLQTGFKKVFELLARGEGLARVLETLVSTIDDLQTGMRSSILILDGDGRRLRHLAGPNLPAEYNRAIDGLEIGPNRGSCGTAAHRGELVVVTDTTRDPLWDDFRDLAIRFGLKACWSRPILSQAGEVLGTFAMYHDRPYRPTPGDLGLVEQAAYLAGVAIERTRAREKLQQSEAALRRSHRTLQDLAGRLLNAQEEERRRLARELHDDLTQRLAAIAIEAGKLENRAASADEHLAAGLGKMRAGIARISNDVHDISRRLHPSILEDLGLVDAIASECRTFSEREGIVVAFSPENLVEPLPRELSICLYRIVQEGLRNIAKHSGTGNASVTLHRENGSVRLLIRDSGVGFDPADLRGRAGLGLASMKERVRLVDGRFSVRSHPGGGTTIEVLAPLREVQR